MTRNDFDRSGPSLSKLARSDSSECSRTSGGPSPDCEALTVLLARRLSILCVFPDARVRSFRPRAPIDKLKFRVFKPFSLDVIFHDCEIVLRKQDICDAFAR